MKEFVETDFPKGTLKRTKSTRTNSFHPSTNINIQKKVLREEKERLETYLLEEILRYEKKLRRNPKNRKKSKFKEKR
jgi:hypothetical protein